MMKAMWSLRGVYMDFMWNSQYIACITFEKKWIVGELNPTSSHIKVALQTAEPSDHCHVTM